MIERADCRLVSALHPSPNFGERRGTTPTILLLHYTGVATAAQAIAWLADPRSKVSCHYVVDEMGLITQMVAEEKRAWHAGVGSWAGDRDINSSSIGIEIQNPGHDAGYPDFPSAQIASLERLAADIIARHRIRRERVLAHSDIAPERKIDPGEKFPWDRLATAGIGLWVPPAPIQAEEAVPPAEISAPVITEAQAMLRNFGYAVELTGVLDSATRLVVAAFQRHFRPARVDGRLDQSTVETLRLLSAQLRAATMIS